MTTQATTKKPRRASKTAKTTPQKTAKARQAKPRSAKSAKAKDEMGKITAIDAAAQVLADAKEPMTTKQLIEAMDAKKLWSSPGGKTPERTLYAALLREINATGKQSRFKRLDRGKFTVKG